MPIIPFCGPTYTGRSTNIDATRSVNFYPEITGTQDNKTQMALVGTPGTLLFATDLGTTPVRALYTVGGVLYAIINTAFYEVSSTGALTLRGTLATSSGRVIILDNGQVQSGVGGNQILIIDGTNGYTYLTISPYTFATLAGAGDGWADLLDSSHYPKSATYLDGYFIVTNDTMSFWVSNLYNGSVWNALATASVIASPDNIVAVTAHRQQLFFMKHATTEVWYNAGVPTTTGSPFVRQSGAVFDFGCAAKWSVARGGGSLFFVANQRIDRGGEYIGVAEIVEYQPQIISTPAISWKVSQAADISTIFGFCYSEQGHTFYMLTYPGTDVTFQDTGDTITFTSGKYQPGDTVTFETITSTTGISTNTAYYLINKSGMTFQLSATLSGSPIALTTDGSGKISDSWTLCYDTSTKMWHERASFISSFGSCRRHLSNCYTYYAGKHFVGDYRSSAIYEMSSDYLTDNGLAIYSWRNAQTVFDPNELSDVFINMIAVDCETGIGGAGTLSVVTIPHPAGDDHITASLGTVTRTDISATATGFSSVAGSFAGFAVGSKILVSGFTNTAINGSYTVESIGSGPSSIHTTVHPVATEAAGNSVVVYNYNDVLILADGSITAGAILIGSTAPTISLSWSNDGGHTWSANYQNSMGAPGAYGTRVRWRRLGRSNNRVFRIGISDAIKKHILGAYVEVGL